VRPHSLLFRLLSRDAHTFPPIFSLDVKSETDKLEFHSSSLNLGNASVFSDALKTTQTDTSRTFEPEQERAILHFATPFPAGSKIQLRIAFDGVLTGAMMGYYKSKYDLDEKTAYYALTQFEVWLVLAADPMAHERTTHEFFSSQRRPAVRSRAGTSPLSKRRLPSASSRVPTPST
jgi:aminopeptidase 2